MYEIVVEYGIMLSEYTAQTKQSTVANPMSEIIPKWAKDLKSPKVSKLQVSNSVQLVEPFGIKEENIEGNKAPKVIDHDAKNRITKLTIQRAWQISSEPLKSVPMNMIMSYMSGNSLQIISIMTAAMLVSNPFKSILEVKSKFQHLISKEYETPPPVFAAMVMYIIYQLILMAIGLHKLNSMGLFPTTSSDWLAWQLPTEYLYRSSII
ncbi:unnamed protein product [Kluyveromyces dobzhanskii CBS 2104]|uniref:ER membrane protein complex subunit 4 n=1 Tax=Kluyveromyces dobzhanskii CBS 2104 TaxID=1427455 RepID=A0A0A8KYY8_9SACH|nr:unnamed protein product [Kluyveromyces dobzhanskii CBS 2104]